MMFNDGTPSLATAVTLPATSKDFDANEDNKYPNLVTIDASAVTVPVAVSAVDGNASCLIASNAKCTLTGGADTNVFIHEGGADVITDYTINDRDKVNLANGKNMGDISGVKVDTTGATLTFGANDTYGTGYVLEDDKLRTATRRGITLTTAENYTIASGEVSVIANAGGTIRIANCISGDQLSLVSGYTVSGTALDETNHKFTLTVGDGTETNSIILEGVTFENLPFIKVNGTAFYIPYENLSSYPMVFGENNTQVSLYAATSADFGAFSVEGGIETSPTTSIGTEYYSALQTITATQENVTVVGNAKPNTFEIVGGASNVLTGGLGKDTFVFESGGGVITDFGIGTTKNGANKYLATTTKRTSTSTYVGYNRDDPTSYAQGHDELKVNGTVVEIAFRQDSEDYDSSKERTFTAYVTYLNKTNTYSTIALANIAKKVTKTNKSNIELATYVTNLEQMQGQTADGSSLSKPKIYDTSTGTSESLTGTALTDLYVDKSNSAHSSAIAALDTIIQARGITTYSADGKIASVSNGVVAAYAQQGGQTP